MDPKLYGGDRYDVSNDERFPPDQSCVDTNVNIADDQPYFLPKSHNEQLNLFSSSSSNPRFVAVKQNSDLAQMVKVISL